MNKVAKFFVSLQRMKVLSLFLCLYFMLLSVMPCSDVEECTESINTSIAALESHGDHSHEAELCSPFCVCLCCGQFTNFPMNVPVASQIANFSTPLAPTYQSGFPLEVHLSIWQPPKLS
jgi:hypothetical protein